MQIYSFWTRNIPGKNILHICINKILIFPLKFFVCGFHGLSVLNIRYFSLEKLNL